MVSPVAWRLSGVALVWLGLTRAWYALLWWMCGVPVRTVNGHVHREAPPFAWTWAGCVALGALVALWLVYKMRREQTTLLVLGAVFLLGSELVPNFIRCRCMGFTSACKAHLKNMGTALEMYSHYPASASVLTPRYLKTIPTCPRDGVHYAISVTPAAYTVVCRDPDHYHRPGYPQYTSRGGLVEP